MKRVIVKSVFDAFDYVMAHYYPAGLKDLAEKKDTYAVISIQDTHTGGFGFKFMKSECCKGVLTLYFDDTVKPVPGAVLFGEYPDVLISGQIDFVALVLGDCLERALGNADGASRALLVNGRFSGGLVEVDRLERAVLDADLATFA